MVTVSFITILSASTLLWAIAQSMKNNSIVDIFWGTGFFIVALIGFFYSEGPTLPQYIMLTMVGIWSLRLSIHIFLRNRGKKEDWRYRQMRKKWKHPALGAFLQVFLLQGILILLISMPVLVVMSSGQAGKPIIQWLGVTLFLAGFLIEAIADGQLRHFLKSPQHPRFLTTGLWSLSRHPNYLGEAILWWGLALFALSHPFGGLGLISALVVTLLVRYISGVPYHEKKHAQNPEWQAYSRRTPIFLPWKSKQDQFLEV